MADVDMPDAPPKAKTSKTEGDTGGKKRFEVKKVDCHVSVDMDPWLIPCYSGMP